MLQVPKLEAVNRSGVFQAWKWAGVFDARYPGGTYKDTLLRGVCRNDGDSVAAVRNWVSTFHATQSTSASQSAFQEALTGRVNGVSTVGSDDTYSVPSGTHNARYLHGFLVVNWTGTPDGNRHHFINSGSSGILLRVGRSSETSGAIQLGLGGVGALITGPGAFATGISLIEYQYSDNQPGGGGTNAIKLYVNNSLIGQFSYATKTDTVGAHMTHFMGNGGAENHIGDWYCHYWHESSTAFIDSATRTAIRAQLRTEFNNAFSV